MSDPILKAAQDPSCLLCLTPDRGGSWWSRLRPAMPRNFAANPMTWTDFMAAIADATETDWSFKIKYTLNGATGSQRIFCGGSNTGPIAIFWSSDGLMYLRTIGGNGTIIQANPASDPTGTHTVEIIAASGLYSIIYDGETVRSVQDTPTIPVLVTGDVISSQFYGTIEQAEFLCGAVVWQAAYSDLYDTSNPWPSPVPRNFAEEPEAWRDEKTTAPLIGEDDCEFFIRYRLDGYPEGSAISQIFYHNSQNGSVNIAFAGDGTGGNYSVIRLTDTDGVVIPLDRVRQLGEHTIRVRRVGLTVTVEFDGEVAATSTGMEKVAVYSTTAPVSDFDGVIFETYWKSLTTGRTVWRYPSDAERVRLITKTNIRTDRGYFEQADTTVNSYVNTALDLRGRVSSYTVFIDFYPAVFPESNNAECHQELAGQGGALIGSDFPPICSVGYYKTVDQTYRLQFAQQSGSLRRTVNVTLAAALSGRCRIVGVVDVQSSSTTLTLYLDGEQIGTSTYSGIPDGTAASIARCFSVAGVKEYGGWINYTGKVYSCLLFDRALSAAEIAALTPKQV